MFKKGLVTLVCLTVMSALWSWATTSYSVQTNIAPLGTYDTGSKTPEGKPIYAPVIGGSVKIRTLAVGDSIAAKDWATHTGGTKTATVLTTQTVEVDVDAADGYKIGSVKKATYSIVNGIPVQGDAVPVTLDGPEFHTETIVDQAPLGRTQTLYVTFVPKADDGGNPLNWQLQVQNNNIGGSILVNRGVSGQATYLNQTVSTIGKPWIKNFLDDGKVTLTVSAAPGYKIDYITKNGVKTFLAGNDVSEVVELAGTINARIKSLNVGYKKLALPVTTHDGAKISVNTLNGPQEVLKDYGILPINPVADPYGVVRLIVTPTASQNKVNSITVAHTNEADGPFAGTVKYFDRFGTVIPVLGSHIGPVKVTISNITKPVTVTASYGTDLTKSPAVASCTQTCHLDTTNVAQSVRDAATEWAGSVHSNNPYHPVDCVGCHQTMPGPALTAANNCKTCHAGQYAPALTAAHDAGSSCLACHNPHSTEAAVATCASCHTTAAPALHTAAHNACATCHNVHDAAAPGTHAKNMAIDSCGKCHTAIAATFATSQHGTRQGKDTWYSDNIGNAAAPELQKGFGNYVNVTYTSLPCGKCHNAAAWTPAGGTDQWASLTGGKSVCQDCHGNRAANADTTAPDAAVAKTTCFGCHSRQKNETAAGLSDVHFVAGMTCTSCHANSDFHGTGTQTASQLVFGTISAQCENCHGEGKVRGPISARAEHTQHAGNIACATCHAESMITCHNCHFDNEAGAGGATKAKFFSGRFGGTVASGNSWRYLVNRVMPDGSTKVYPGSMQSLVADYTVDNVDGAEIHTHAGIAPYYSHTITRTNALTCDKCHGIENAVKLNAGVPIRVITWKGAANEQVPFADMMTKYVGPKGVIPVPENPRGKLLMDFVDLVNPAAPLTADKTNSTSARVLLQKDGPDTIHMPEAYVKPLSAAQIQDLANPYRADKTTEAAAHSGVTNNDCAGCHTGMNTLLSTALHGTRPGKETFYTDGMDETNPAPLQQGFGNFVTVPYSELPCAGCHNAAATTVDGVDTWTGASCQDCHNPATPAAAVSKPTCYGCHSRQAYEGMAFGLTDVHGNMACSSCHSTTDLHGDGTAKKSMLDPGAITAACTNCHGAGKSRGPISQIAEHTIHMSDMDCSTCHIQSVVACYNCHFDNEGLHEGVTHQKFASAKFGGQGAKSWRFLVNRVMPDGSTKIFPGSMQSLMADVTAKDDGSETEDQVVGDGQGVTFVAIASYYSHSVTKVDALRCFDCHGTAKVNALAAGQPVDVVKWTGNEGEVFNYGPEFQSKWQGPQGVIPVPPNTSLLKFDFVDITNPAAPWDAVNMNVMSPRTLFKRGADVIHMPDSYVKPLTQEQLDKLADPQVDHALNATAMSTAPSPGYTQNTCNGCHEAVNTTFASSLHGTREGKLTFYNNNLGNAEAPSLQKGFGNYVQTPYAELPCAKCHNAAAWTVGGVDTWPGTPVCTDCHTNRTAGAATTAFDAPVTAATCKGCHSRQAVEGSTQGLTDVHMTTYGMTCTTCHSTTDMHGSGAAPDSLLAEGGITAQCSNCHNMGTSTIPEHTVHLANIDCSTCHMESVITCYGCHFDNEAGAPGALHAKFASGRFGGPGAAAWRFLVNRVMPDGSTKVYPGSMQSLVADYTVDGADDGVGHTHAAIAPYYSHSITTKDKALKCDSCHGTQKAIDLANGLPVRVVKWAPNTTLYPDGIVPVSAMGASYTVKPSGIIPVPENPVGKLLMDFVDLVDPSAGPLNASGTSPSARKLFKADGPDTIHMPEQYVKPLTAAQIQKLATPQVRPQ